MNIQQKIEAMQLELDALKVEAEKCKLDLSYKDGCHIIGAYTIEGDCNGTDKNFTEYGRYRDTEAQAEFSLARQKRSMRLEALVMKIQGDKLGGNCTVYSGGKEYLYVIDISPNPEAVTMTVDTAIKVCEILSNGSYSLD